MAWREESYVCCVFTNVFLVLGHVPRLLRLAQLCGKKLTHIMRREQNRFLKVASMCDESSNFVKPL